MTARVSARYLDAYGVKGNPNWHLQARHPRGRSEGGQWLSGGGSAGGGATGRQSRPAFAGDWWGQASTDDPRVQAEWGAWQERLTDDQAAALSHYTTTNSHVFNVNLRAGTPVPDDIQAKMRQIDAALAGHRLTQDIVTFRGMGGPQIHGMLESGQIKVGTRFGDRGYVSSSLDMWSAENFAGMHFNEGVLVEMRIRRGARAGHVDRFSDMPVHPEYEVLLARSPKFTVTRVERFPSGQFRLVVEHDEDPDPPDLWMGSVDIGRKERDHDTRFVWRVVVEHDENPAPPDVWLGAQTGTKDDPDHEPKFLWDRVTETEVKAGDHWRGQPRKPRGRPDGGEWAGSGHGFGLYIRPNQDNREYAATYALFASDAPVKVATRAEHGADRAEIESFLFGRSLADHEYGSLVGAPPGSRVQVEFIHPTGTLPHARITTSHPHYNEQIRTVMVDERDQVFVSNDSFFLKSDAPAGLATTILHRQVQATSRLGIQYIDTYAAGNYRTLREGFLNGYYTWARLGYDGAISDDIRDRLPRQYRSARQISELMAMPGGVDAWKQHGSASSMRFDVTPGSASRRRLETYIMMKQRANEGKAEMPPDQPSMTDSQGRRGDQAQILSAEDEAILDQIDQTPVRK